MSKCDYELQLLGAPALTGIMITVDTQHLGQKLSAQRRDSQNSAARTSSNNTQAPLKEESLYKILTTASAIEVTGSLSRKHMAGYRIAF